MFRIPQNTQSPLWKAKFSHSRASTFIVALNVKIQIEFLVGQNKQNDHKKQTFKKLESLNV